MAVWRFVTVWFTDRDGDGNRVEFNTIRTGKSLWAQAYEKAVEEQKKNGDAREITTITIVEPYVDGHNR